MKQTQYLDAAKKSLEIESDYALAPHLDMTRQAVSKLRNGRLVMSNTTAAKISEITGIPLGRVIADLELERGGNDQLWRRIRDAAVVALIYIGAASFGVLPQDARASGFNNNLFAARLAAMTGSIAVSGLEVNNNAKGLRAIHIAAHLLAALFALAGAAL